MPPTRRATGHRARVGLLLAFLGALAALTWGGGPAAVAATTAPAGTAIVVTTASVPVRPEPDGTAVSLDTTTYAPAGTGRHPAVLLAHGFGGSKADLDGEARDLAGHGNVVLAYTARGFGASGGRIHLDDPDFEIADARRLIDVLAARPDVQLDAPGDPRVAVAGASYGGALALMTAGSDRRVDAVAALITWNDLAQALFPQNLVSATAPRTPAEVDPVGGPGPFKQLWASRFFGAALAGAKEDGAPPAKGAPPTCGRFDETVCTLLLDAAQTGTPSTALLTLLRAHSPAPTLAKVTAPTLLVQGMGDSLFGLDQADANARGLAAAGAPVAIRWMDGGHDGPSSTAGADTDAVRAWLEHYLDAPITHPSPTAPEPLPVPAFSYALPIRPDADRAELATLTSYPGLSGSPATTWRTLPFAAASAGQLVNPPGGQPASVSSIPALGDLGNLVPTYDLAALPGQSIAFDSEPAPDRLTVAGTPRLRLRITSTGTSATLYASLWQLRGSTPELTRRLTAPATVALTPGAPTEVTNALPAATYSIDRGSRWRVLLTSTDTAYAGPRDARIDQVALIGGGLELPVVTGALAPVPTPPDRETEWVLGATGGLLLLLALLAGFRRLRGATAEPIAAVGGPDTETVSLRVDRLVKTYADGHRAVDDVSWTAERGQVVGLLGPNGAGKTTTMRMMLGLIRPDSGRVSVLGRPVTPGAPVLGQVGALVEGPGFLPHLSGRDNLIAYWAATGRPAEEAGIDEALGVAALGGAVDRPVRTYSHGMKQRLGIAQAMLGLPEVLLLDEPTNGLDPPQIAGMRPILHAYAAAGRTVVVSSHLLGEVEQTCSHVVVMHAGRVVTTGRVADLLTRDDLTDFELGEGGIDAAGLDAIRAIPGVDSVDLVTGLDGGPDRLSVVASRPRVEVVRAVIDAGVPVIGVGSRRHLEEVFLGAIDAAQPPDPGSGGGSLIDRLRQVRAR